ncbi:uncharacterized protein LOC125239904 isoform X2 [Leguminivora glycinivorella]|uniref:uncharacterized protein LOC125239904 isoform X2 n=1 Tax=Leguminivora glycinivorella TaxID=1035111 RepID=UPI00200D313A|nr:uncharacterized protein LOC125239904 isoform X2 [Leguminivora glycinivorella]
MSEKIRFTPFMRQCLVAAAVSINMVGFGCTAGFPGIMLPQLQEPGSTISVTKDQASWLGPATRRDGTWLLLRHDRSITLHLRG